MRSAPNWRPGHRANGTYRGPMVQCPNCGYATWRAHACPFCGAPLEAPSAGIPEGPAPRAEAMAPRRPPEFGGGFPTLFLVWFLAGLLAGIAGFSPHARAAGVLLWPHVERLLLGSGHTPAPQSSLPAPPQDRHAGRPAPAV